MELSALFETCFVILALMLVGFFGVRRGIYPSGFSKAASWLVVNIFLVGSIFQSICSGNAGLSPKELPHVLLVVIVTILLGYVLGFLTLRLSVCSCYLQNSRLSGIYMTKSCLKGKTNIVYSCFTT